MTTLVPFRDLAFGSVFALNIDTLEPCLFIKIGVSNCCVVSVVANQLYYDTDKLYWERHNRNVRFVTQLDTTLLYDLLSTFSSEIAR